MSTFRKESREEWSPAIGHQISHDQIQIGCLQRIADAAECMAKNHQQLLDENARLKRWYDEEKQTARRLYRQTIALRGVITKLKRKP